MSKNSKKKAGILRELNKRPDVLEKRQSSRKFHEAVVKSLVDGLRNLGWRCYTLSEYVKEERTPDAILFDGKELVALEVELQKRWKPTEESMIQRLSDLNRSSNFFDRTKVVFPKEGTEMTELISSLLGAIVENKRLNPEVR